MPVESPVSADMAGIESMNMPDMADWQFADGVDPEIAEVFIEEANEVLGELDQLIPLWLAGDQTALQDIRRHFHTLKGSGRMAGATVIGELAWAVEDILNRVIDNSLLSSENVEMLTAEAHQLMTPLLIQFVKADMRQTEQVDALHALKAACLSPTPAVDTPTSLPDNNLIVEPEVVELENDIEPLSLDASTFNDLDDTNEALEAFAEEQHDVTPDELLTSEETQEESYTQPEEWVVDLTLDDSTVEETTIEAFESESPAPFSLDTEVLTSVEYYIRQKAEKETAIPVEQAPEVLELSEADLAEFEFDPNDMPGSIESDEAPISFEAELPVSEPEPEPVIIPAVETRPFTGVERYLVAKQRAE
jgi:chemosensory pili system protein ChpA (sensor histidine kinase/response regulator)